MKFEYQECSDVKRLAEKYDVKVVIEKAPRCEQREFSLDVDFTVMDYRHTVRWFSEPKGLGVING